MASIRYWPAISRPWMESQDPPSARTTIA